jgi:hypothetical protein
MHVRTFERAVGQLLEKVHELAAQSGTMRAELAAGLVTRLCKRPVRGVFKDPAHDCHEIIDALKRYTADLQAKHKGRYTAEGRSFLWTLAAALATADVSDRLLNNLTGMRRGILAKQRDRLFAVSGGAPVVPETKERSDALPKWVHEFAHGFWDSETRASEKMADDVSDVHALRGTYQIRWFAFCCGWIGDASGAKSHPKQMCCFRQYAVLLWF